MGGTVPNLLSLCVLRQRDTLPAVEAADDVDCRDMLRTAPAVSRRDRVGPDCLPFPGGPAPVGRTLSTE